MKYMKALLALLLVLTLCAVSSALAQSASVYSPGSRIDDFTVTTCDGRTITLSEVLKEKEAVLINIWATWCGPCRSEFPFMEEAWKQYSDKVEIIALSCEETDTDEVLASFAEEMGLTFNIGRDTVGLASRLAVSAIPTSIVVDRFGTICFREEGSMPDTESFTRLFDAFVGEGYTESVVLSGIPAKKPDVQPSAAEDVAAALNAAGGALTFADGGQAYDWPMVVGEKDGRSVVVSTNQGVKESAAKLRTVVPAKAGDAIVVTFRLSSEAACDLLNIAVNGEPVKVFGGERDWMTYAIPVEADGEYALTLSYEKDVSGNGGEDTLWVDAVAVVSGDAAADALASNPVYPTGAENTLTITNPEAREIVISDENGILKSAFGDADYYIVNGDRADFTATLNAETDPEGAFFYAYYDGARTALIDAMTESGYAVSTGVDAMNTTGYVYCYLAMFLDSAGNEAVVNVLFRDEENVDAFVQHNALGTWTYAEEARSADAGLSGKDAGAAAEADYVIRYVDQDGNPVAGVMCQVCDEATCQVFVSDAEGVCAFTLAPYAWEIHTLKVPEGYEGDTATITLAPVEGGEMVFTLTKK